MSFVSSLYVWFFLCLGLIRAKAGLCVRVLCCAPSTAQLDGLPCALPLLGAPVPSSSALPPPLLPRPIASRSPNRRDERAQCEHRGDDSRGHAVVCEKRTTFGARTTIPIPSFR